MTNLAPHIAEFAKRIVINKLRFATGTKVYCNPDYVERDGRKRKAVIKELQRLGYIGEEEVDNSSSIKSLRCEIKEKAYKELQAIPVNLVAHWKAQREHIRRGVLRGILLRSLSDNEVKYLIENKENYTFFIGKVRDFINGMGEAVLVEYVPGTDTCETTIKGWSDAARSRYPDTEVVVCDDSLTAYIDDLLWQESVDSAMNQNFAWGLTKLGVVSEDVAKVVSVSEVPGMLFGTSDSTSSFPPDYTKWEAVLPEKVAQTRQRLDAVAKKLENLNLLWASVEKYGWEKFLADYRQAIEEALAKRQEAKEEKVA